MPYNASGAFNLLPGTYGLPNTTIKSAPYNAAVDDFAQALNTPRQVTGGGTGATTAEQALENLGGIRTNDIDELFAGIIAPWPTAAAPSGWLACNGAVVSRVTYARLFSRIGTTYGAGDGSSTFHLPDLRGEFIRGLDQGRGVDTGRTLGSLQDDDLAPHVHSGVTSVNGSHTHTVGIETNFTAGSEMAAGVGYAQGALAVQTSSGGSHTHTVTIESAGGAESRPRNIALLYCVKT